MRSRGIGEGAGRNGEREADGGKDVMYGWEKGNNGVIKGINY